MRTSHSIDQLRSEVEQSGLAAEYLDYLTATAVKLYAAFMGMREFDENDPISKRILSQRVKAAEVAAAKRLREETAPTEETKSQHQTARTILTKLPSDGYREVLRGCDTLMKLAVTCGYSTVHSNFLFSPKKPYKINEDAGSVIDKRLKVIIADLVRESERPIKPPRKAISSPIESLSSPVQTDLPPIPQGTAWVENIAAESPTLYSPVQHNTSSRTKIESREGAIEIPSIFRPTQLTVETTTPIRRSKAERSSPIQQSPAETDFTPPIAISTSSSTTPLISPIKADLPPVRGENFAEDIEAQSPILYSPGESEYSSRTKIGSREGTIEIPSIHRPLDLLRETATPTRRSRAERPSPTQQSPAETDFAPLLPVTSVEPTPIPPIVKKATEPKPILTKKEQEDIKLRQTQKLNSRDRADGDTDLHFMVRNELNYLLIDTLERLESHSVGKVNDYLKTNLRNSSRETPLHLAIATGNLEITRLLLKYKFKDSLNLVNEKKQSPLHIAVENGNIDLAQLLIDNGARLLPTMAELSPTTPEMIEFLARQDSILKSSSSKEEGARTAKEVREQMLKRLSSKPPLTSLPTPTTETAREPVVRDYSLANRFAQAAKKALEATSDKFRKSAGSSKSDSAGSSKSDKDEFSFENPLLKARMAPEENDSLRSPAVPPTSLTPRGRGLASILKLTGTHINRGGDIEL